MLRMPAEDVFEALSAVNISCSMGSTWQVQNAEWEDQLWVHYSQVPAYTTAREHSTTRVRGCHLCWSSFNTHTINAASSCSSRRVRWDHLCLLPRGSGCPGKQQGLLWANVTAMSQGMWSFQMPIFINSHYRTKSVVLVFTYYYNIIL